METETVKTDQQEEVPSLRLDSYLMGRLGLIRNKIYITIKDYYVNVVPYELSQNGCRAISVLGQREVAFFQQYVGKTYRFHLTLRENGATTPATLHIDSTIVGLKQHNPESNVCVFTLQYRSVPQLYRMQLNTAIAAIERLQEFYHDDETRRVSIDTARFEEAGHSRSVNLLQTGESSPIRAKATQLSFSRIELFGDFGTAPLPSEEFEVDFPDPTHSVLVKGHVVRTRQSQEVTEFFFVELDLEYSVSYLELIRPFVPTESEG